MQNNAESSRGIRPGILLTVLATVGILVGALLLGKKKPTPEANAAGDIQAPADSPTSPAPTQTAPPFGVRRPSSIAVPSSVPGTAPAAITAPQDAVTAVAVSTEVTNWEQRIDAILGRDGTDEGKKADELLGLFPSLPEDGQIEAAQHIANLLPDERYSALAPTLTNPLTNEQVLEALLTDLLNRPDPIKLPLLLQLARTPDHPKAVEARDILEVYVDENFGTDWPKWEMAVQKYLQENPE